MNLMWWPPLWQLWNIGSIAVELLVVDMYLQVEVARNVVWGRMDESKAISRPHKGFEHVCVSKLAVAPSTCPCELAFL